LLGQLTPKYLFLTKGVGVDEDDLHAFEVALRVAGVADQNLVGVSSILPPGCKIISKELGVKFMMPGDIRFCVKAEMRDDEPHRYIGASVGIAVPKDKNRHGYLSEYHKIGWNPKELGEHAEDKAAEFLATVLGIEGFNSDLSWNQKEEFFKMEGQIVRTHNVTACVKGNNQGKYTAVVALAVFLFQHDIDRWKEENPGKKCPLV
jgi:arginine decarboxylase